MEIAEFEAISWSEHKIIYFEVKLLKFNLILENT